MTSKSEHSNRVSDVEQLTNQALNDANASLPENIRADIIRARTEALLESRKSRESLRSIASNWLGIVRDTLSSSYDIKIMAATPFAVAALVAVLVSYTPTETIPAIPAELIASDIPAEDLSLLEDLEFATWLEQQAAEATY